MFLRFFRCGRAVPVVAAAALLAVPVAALAQTPAAAPPAKAAAAKPDAPLPAAREIIDRFVRTIGGRSAVLAHKSMHVTGKYEVPASGLSGDLEIFTAAAPNRAYQRVTIPGVGEVLQGFDGERGWSINPMTGPMLQQGKELEQAKLDSDFYSELRDPKNYKSITTVERTTFEGRPCYKVSLVRTDGVEDFDFYDQESGLRIGTMQTRETPMGTITSTNVEGDYKKFGDLMQATSLTVKAMGVEQKISVATVEYDAVPPAAFEPPASIKALIK
jgi:hypothetical protein